MNELNKLIQLYETENPGKKVKDPFFDEWEDEFVLWFASRSTCGEQQRLFLDEVEKAVIDKDGDLIINDAWQPVILWRKRFKADLQKVIKGN